MNGRTFFLTLGVLVILAAGIYLWLKATTPTDQELELTQVQVQEFQRTGQLPQGSDDNLVELNGLHLLGAFGLVIGLILVFSYVPKLRGSDEYEVADLYFPGHRERRKRYKWEVGERSR